MAGDAKASKPSFRDQPHQAIEPERTCAPDKVKESHAKWRSSKPIVHDKSHNRSSVCGSRSRQLAECDDDDRSNKRINKNTKMIRTDKINVETLDYYFRGMKFPVMFLVVVVVLTASVSHFITCRYILYNINQDNSDKFAKMKMLSMFPSDVSWFSRDPLHRDQEVGDMQIRTADSVDTNALATAHRKLEVKESLKVEAKASFNAALDMMEMDKLDKARKLAQHAIYLDPLNPDALNLYGELMESSDVLLADHLFNQAIVVSPSHTRALMNIRRTTPFVQEFDAALYHRIDSKRDSLMHIPDNHPGLRRLKKETYYQQIYHSVAIEGNTLNLYQTRSIIETRMTVGGKSVMEHNEVIGMDAALSYINSTLLNRIGRISLSDILEIHKRVLGYVDPIEAGQIRNTQVFVGDYIPPRPGEVQALMEEFVEWLNAEDTLSLHPIKLAAIAHYKLVTIHPFYDGNGRTSRLLMNVVLMNSGYPPVMIRVEEKHDYYKHLETANRGDIRPFIRFIAMCTERTVDEYLTALTDDGRHLRDVSRVDMVDDGRTIILGDDKY